jgi:hypothetical protein
MNYIDIVMEIDSEEIDMYLEEERKKCLKNIQDYYKKYGCDKIDILQKYLESLCETLTDKSEVEEIKKQILLLKLYS